MIGIIIGLLAVLLLFIIMTGYVKASPDEAIIISGYKEHQRVVTGRATIKIPFLERKDRLTLRAIKIDVKTQKPVPTNEFIDVSVDSVVTVQISRDEELIKKAAQNFLNQPEDYIMNMVTDVLEGNIREIIGKMTLKDMISDRQAFGNYVEENAAPDMAKMGIEIISFNIQNFWDEKGIIEALGVENTSKIKMTAEITRADAEKNVKIAKAQADKASNDEEVKSKQEIAEKQHELNIKTSQLKQLADAQKAQADAAYAIQEENQRKIIEIARAEANLAKQEKEIELQERQVRIEEQKLDASIKKRAEADKYARNQIADAKLYEVEKQSESEIAKARAAKIAAEENAIGVKALALAEAEGIKAKGLAKAEGIDKLAEAQRKMGEASVLEMYFKVLPEIAANVAKPLENVNQITMYGEGNNSKMIEDITKATTQISNGLTDGLGIDVKSMIAGFLGGKVATPNSTISKEDIANAVEISHKRNAETSGDINSQNVEIDNKNEREPF